MTLLELQRIADQGYGDGSMTPYYNQTTGKPKLYAKGGDTLARFVAIELAETFEPSASDENQLEEAQRVIEGAIADLDNALQALWGKWKGVNNAKEPVLYFGHQNISRETCQIHNLIKNEI